MVISELHTARHHHSSPKLTLQSGIPVSDESVHQCILQLTCKGGIMNRCALHLNPATIHNRSFRIHWHPKLPPKSINKERRPDRMMHFTFQRLTWGVRYCFPGVRTLPTRVRALPLSVRTTMTVHAAAPHKRYMRNVKYPVAPLYSRVWHNNAYLCTSH